MLSAPKALLQAEPKTVTILGSTGSVGRSTVDLIKGYREKFIVRALTAHKNVALLAKQAMELGAEYAVIADESLYADLKKALSGSGVKPMASVVEAARMPVDWVMAAIVGAAGVEATLEAIKFARTVALANKESLVCAGPFMMEAVRKSGATLLPVDSEHNAVFQVFKKEGMARVILTASGGPFLRRSRTELDGVTPEQAVKHPNWSMGAKISVDSATMVNKALEIIEASYLFHLKPEQIEAVIHPQSVIHSMVEYVDGSILAQMGAPDMRTPIAHTLAWPDRMETTGNRLDLSKALQLNLEPVDLQRFPAVRMAKEALAAGPGWPTVFNAANEMAVEAFLAGQLKFPAIESVIGKTLQRTQIGAISDMRDVFDLDRRARLVAAEIIRG